MPAALSPAAEISSDFSVVFTLRVAASAITPPSWILFPRSASDVSVLFVSSASASCLAAAVVCFVRFSVSDVSVLFVDSLVAKLSMSISLAWSTPPQ